MNKEYCCDLKELFGIFEEELSAPDILSAKVLSEISSDIMKCRMELGMTQKEKRIRKKISSQMNH